MYTATLESPALCNEKPIQTSSISLLADLLILTGLSKNAHDESEPFKGHEALTRKTQKIRIIGAAAVDICQVACGRAEAYVDSGIYLWDAAAAGLIAERAGAYTKTEPLGDYRVNYMCSNTLIQKELIATLS